MSQLAPIVPKLRKLLPMLSSESEGEQLATVAAIKRMLAGHGLSIHDLADAIATEPARRGHVEPTNIAPIWAMLSIQSKLAWLRAAAENAERGSWLDDFARNISHLLAAGLPLTSKQNASAQQVIADAWAKGLRP